MYRELPGLSARAARSLPHLLHLVGEDHMPSSQWISALIRLKLVMFVTSRGTDYLSTGTAIGTGTSEPVPATFPVLVVRTSVVSVGSDYSINYGIITQFRAVIP